MPGLPALLRCSASLRSQLLAVGALGNAVPGRMDKVCDMKYKMMDSPLGKIELSGCEQGLHGIKLHGRKGADTDPVEAPAPPELLGGPEDVAEPLMQCAAWLDAYFHKPALLTELPLPALHHPVFQQDSFTRQVLWKLLKVVKFGEMISYQQLAALAGNPKAARAVGGAMRNNPEQTLSRSANRHRWSSCPHSQASGRRPRHSPRDCVEEEPATPLKRAGVPSPGGIGYKEERVVR
uniref:Methylated-DNA--protein-cysteine methyltransferase n=1 Tax=Equus caballus TaxID=9796 RepID=A0A9L0SV75_HORSE